MKQHPQNSPDVMKKLGSAYGIGQMFSNKQNQWQGD
jgi:hypothetical protein